MSNRVLRMQGWTPAGAPPAKGGDVQGGVCIPNIDTAARRQRLWAGIIELVVGFGILGVLLALHANPLWRLPLLLVFWGGAVSFYQWRDHT
jgi:uncharacterized membrane protein YccC